MTTDPSALAEAAPALEAALAPLARCVGDEGEFITRFWGKQPLVRRGLSRQGFADLLTLADVDEMVTSSGLRTPSFRLVKDGSPLPPSSYTVTPRISGVPVTGLADPRRVLEAIDDGATLVLQGMHRYRSSLRILCRGLEQRLGCPVQVNAYFTPPGSRGLAVHHDPHDVFVLQCFGSKRWEVHAPDGVWDILLEPGDALYLPQGTDHAATAQDTLSGHLTIGLLTESVRDVLAGTLREVLAGPGFDERLPAGWLDDPSLLAAALKPHLEALAESVAGVDADAVATGAADRFLTGRPSSLRGSLVDRTRLTSLTQATAVCRRAGPAPVVRVGSERLRLLLGDREVTMPSWVEPAVRVLVDGEEHLIGALPGLDDSGRLVLVRRLVREGLLEVRSE